MANDELLWKQVDELKGQAAPAPTRLVKADTAKGPKKLSLPKDGPKTSRRSFARAAKRPSNPPVQRPVDQPVDRLVDRSTAQANGQQLGGQVVNRPVSFYIPRSVDQKIDDAVDYMEKRHGVKVDRSAVVSAILGEPALWEAASLNQLVDKTMQQLTNRLTSRLISRPGS